MFKRTPLIQFEVAYINHVNRDPNPVTEVSLAGECIPNAFVHQMQSEENGLLTIFFFSQAPTPILVLASALSQPKYLLYTKLFAKLCIV